MELDMGWLVCTALMGGIVVVVFGLLKKTNEWIYVSSLGAKQYSLPPGDMGWPFIGNMFSFLLAFKFGDPDSYISALATRYDKARIYKAFMFGSPSIILTSPETCRQILMNDEQFGPGYPKSDAKVLGKKGLHGVSHEEHKRLRRLTTAPIKGHDALSVYIDCIEDIAIAAFDEWARRDRPVEFLTEMRKIAFKVIMNVIMGSEFDLKSMEAMEEDYTLLSHGVKAMTINLPGFAHHKALKARKNLIKNIQGIVDKRRATMRSKQRKVKKDMMDLMMESEDEGGRKLSDEEIVDLTIIYLLAGHESSAHSATWAIIFLQEHPQFLQKAKEEQDEIVKKRPSRESRLSLKEIRQMEYLSKVIDETLRLANISFTLFREAKEDVNINGYIIPKGWKVLAWIRNVHVDPENYSNPTEFNPSRWEDHKIRPGSYIPFGAGSRLCPGQNLAKLELSVFLHYFLLNYELERLNPGCGVKYLPITRPADNCLARIKKLSPSSR